MLVHTLLHTSFLWSSHAWHHSPRYLIASFLTQHITHSNVRIPFPRQVERIFVTPRYHFAHHSGDVARSNSNYGFLSVRK
jgi:hypothetical protein